MNHPDAAKQIEAYKYWGKEIPAVLIAPKIHDVEYDLWGIFWKLSSERNSGMQAGPIPWSTIKKYSQECPWLSEDDLTTIMREMDKVFLTHKPPDAKGKSGG